MKAPQGGELLCKAHNYRFNENNRLVDRGVVTYYAAQALPRSTAVKDWLELIDRLSTSDIKRKRLKPMYQPVLEILGNSATKLPGVSVTDKH
jgi:hypothetical protein